MGTPVTTEQLKKILEGMTKMLQTRMEVAASSSKVTVPQSEQMQLGKIELPPNDIKLEGTKNYLSWVRRAMLCLQTRGLERYVEEDKIEPEDETSVEWRMWSATNSAVVSWLLKSVSSSIAGMIEAISRASDVWKTLAQMYSGAGSAMMMMEIEEKIDATKQGEKTVLQYAAELSGLWADLDHYDPLSLKCSDDVVLGRKYLERRRVIRFLKGLNSQFENRRAAMCHMESLPSLEQVVAAMEQEEIRQKVMLGETTPSVRSALAVPSGANHEDRECYNCGKRGHLSYNCPQPHNPSRG